MATLAEDYAKIDALVFHADRKGHPGSFVGIATPGATRLAIGAVTPELLVAYAAGQAAGHAGPRTPLHSVDAVPSTVAGFAANLSRPETELKIEVTEGLLRAWLGASLLTSSLPAPPKLEAVTRPVLRKVLDRPERYVALTKDERLVQVVDRVELANQLAISALG